MPRRSPSIRIAWRLCALAAILAASALLSALLVRLAPGFGADERMLDPRLSAASVGAIRRERSEGSDIAGYCWSYVRRLAHGDLGTSVSLGRPVSELLAERMGVTARSAAAGLGISWVAALGGVFLLEALRRRTCDAAASLAAGTLLCAPAALVALVCLYAGGTPGLAIAVVLFPRLFRYARGMVRQAAAAEHALAAEALGEAPLRILGLHVAVPIAPELLSLAALSVSMAMGAAIPVEALCDSPGVGQLAWQAAVARDLPVVVNVTLLIAGVTATVNAAAETVRAAREAEA